MEKMKSVASIPANYVTILQLQERWLKEKERKQKEKENGVKQQVGDGQGRREEDTVMKVKEAMEPKGIEKVKLGENGEGGNSRKKKNQSGSVVKYKTKVSPAYIRRVNDPVKEEIPRYSTLKKGENNAVETQMQNLWISKRAKEEGQKGPARWNNGRGYYRNQTHDWSSSRGVIRATESLVWVKKEKNGVAGAGNGVSSNI